MVGAESAQPESKPGMRFFHPPAIILQISPKESSSVESNSSIVVCASCGATASCMACAWAAAGPANTGESRCMDMAATAAGSAHSVQEPVMRPPKPRIALTGDIHAAECVTCLPMLGEVAGRVGTSIAVHDRPNMRAKTSCTAASRAWMGSATGTGAATAVWMLRSIAGSSVIASSRPFCALVKLHCTCRCTLGLPPTCIDPRQKL